MTAAVGAFLVLFAGYTLSPDTLGPTRAGDVIHWGGWTLESAFYLACLIAAVQSFRILESLFRHREAKVLATLPLRLPGLYFYRLGAAVLETGLLALGAALFLLPVCLNGGVRYFVAALVLLAIAVVLIVVVGFAAQMIAGVADYKYFPDFFASLDKRSGGTGGGAAAYLLSPAAALGVNLALLLLTKLSIDEVLKNYGETFSFGITGIARAAAIFLAVVVFVSIAWGYRNFTRHYPVLFARFFEADLHVVDVGYDYFARDRRPAKGLEARLTGHVRTLYRLYRLQLARRTPLGGAMLVAAPITSLGLFLGYGSRLDPWMVAGIGLGWLLLLTNPWSRLHHPAMDPGLGLVLPTSHRDRRRARLYLLIREALFLTVPFALTGLVLPNLEQISAAFLVPAVAVSLVPVLDSAARASHQAPRAIGFLVVAFFAALTSVGFYGPWLGFLGLAVWAMFSVQTRQTPTKAAA
jgi:hypothetical protein